ncbi:FixH family protein [Pedobacter rhizosphaerae]|uniref:FixH protein n=1 Tax=Pedobacter rhizosphaerae TaxID=390241 RepID=A0A1H9UTU9_9SPHI|nr:FixH family protein [Pedobacter rhizosphaerae]SES12826.1 hypothetical protein SAMN04488023_1344 [Pedobacter rhizosphaerae]
MNWGTKIIIGMSSFMLFIVGMVFYMFTLKDRDTLVEDDYYEKGMNYNETYNATQNVIKEQLSPQIKVGQKQIVIQLKNKIDFELQLMRPSSAAEDVKMKGKTIEPNHLILIDRGNMRKGLWVLTLCWTNNQQEYLYKTNITL